MTTMSLRSSPLESPSPSRPDEYYERAASLGADIGNESFTNFLTPAKFGLKPVSTEHIVDLSRPDG